MIRRRLAPVLLALAVGVAALGPAARAAERDAAGVRGFVDGSAFGGLGGEDAEVVEIHLGPTLLGAIAHGAREDPEAAELLGGLRSVSAYIVGLAHDPERTAKAAKLLGDMEEQLVRGGWERLARVREKGDRVNVFVLGSGGTVDGLVVLAFDRDGAQVVFANLAGRLDLAKLGRIQDALDVPGLDAVEGATRSGGADATSPRKQDLPRGGDRPREDAP